MNTVKKHSSQSNAKSKTKILLIEDTHYKHKNIMSVLDDAQYEVCCVLDVASLYVDKSCSIEISDQKDKTQQTVKLKSDNNGLVNLFNDADKNSKSSSLIKKIEQHNPDIILIGIELPHEKMLISLQTISDFIPTPIVMFSKQEGVDLIQPLIKAGVTSYIAGVSDFTRIKSILETASARFNEEQKLKQELSNTKNKLFHHRTVEQAKLLLMKNKNCTEQEAYHNMRKMAMDNGQKVEDVAKNILSLSAII